MKWGMIQPLIGGMGLGAYEAINKNPEFIISGGAPNDEKCINYFNNTKKLNIPVIKMDGTYTEYDNIEDKKLFNDIDIVVGVPICSGLSMLNSSNRGADAHQNDNMYQMAEFILNDISPKCYIFENAPGLYTSKDGKKVCDKLLKIAEKYNYSASIMKTDTFLHGIPQHRHRSFFFFWKTKTSPILKYDKKDTPFLTEYLKDVNDTMTHYNDYLKNPEDEYTFKYVKAKNIDFRKELTRVGRSSLWQYFLHENLLEDYIEFMKSDEKYARGLKKALHVKSKLDAGLGFWDNSIYFEPKGYVNAVISKSIANCIHPTEDRHFNIRELFHLMGFPHDFELDNPIKNINMIAQNVPVKTAKFWVEEVMEVLNGNRKLSNGLYVKQNNEKQKIDFIEENKNELINEIFS